jgi:phosphatidylinositol kinase/protein kinase (PI-3  family)
MNRLSLILNTADISPYLSELNSSLVPIPGQEFLPFDGTNGKDLITIYKVNRSSFVLPTKTRPKKICFTGSNGKE